MHHIKALMHNYLLRIVVIFMSNFLMQMALLPHIIRASILTKPRSLGPNLISMYLWRYLTLISISTWPSHFSVPFGVLRRLWDLRVAHWTGKAPPLNFKSCSELRKSLCRCLSVLAASWSAAAALVLLQRWDTSLSFFGSQRSSHCCCVLSSAT